MAVYHGSVSESELRVVEVACDLVLAVDNRLKAFAHSREVLLVSEVKDSLNAAEIALRGLLVPGEAS